MENLELNKCKFILGRYAYNENDIKNGLKPAPHRALRDCNSLYLELKDCKTINFLKMCNIFNLTLTEKILIILKEPNKNLQLSLRNLNNFEYILANQLNLTEITKANKIILDEKAFAIIKETYFD
jgi:ribosomal protein L4